MNTVFAAAMISCAAISQDIYAYNNNNKIDYLYVPKTQEQVEVYNELDKVEKLLKEMQKELNQISHEASTMMITVREKPKKRIPVSYTTRPVVYKRPRLFSRRYSMSRSSRLSRLRLFNLNCR